MALFSFIKMMMTILSSGFLFLFSGGLMVIAFLILFFGKSW